MKKMTKAEAKGLGTARQYAALPFRKLGKNKTEVLLITSRETRRWVVPKGWPMKNKTGQETAEIEAFEEAGVAGVLWHRALGSFGYLKQRVGKFPIACEVELYPLEVTEELSAWPEQDERERKWFTPSQAAKLVHEPELKALLRTFGAKKSIKAREPMGYPRGLTRLAAQRAGKLFDRIGI
ncbi:NUDIX hydrolase [Polycladidibacter hongkongensis]|uniref:NUDIX hydrolase n=1 Tax=Polycladidibacter hongkongensis TaxID=1647556 RepID=UPI000AD87735|nr:NUDIX hydrolase [Pseudovibrio hongkongensis]